MSCGRLWVFVEHHVAILAASVKECPQDFLLVQEVCLPSKVGGRTSSRSAYFNYFIILSNTILHLDPAFMLWIHYFWFWNAFCQLGKATTSMKTLWSFHKFFEIKEGSKFTKMKQAGGLLSFKISKSTQIANYLMSTLPW